MVEPSTILALTLQALIPPGFTSLERYSEVQEDLQCFQEAAVFAWCLRSALKGYLLAASCVWLQSARILGGTHTGGGDEKAIGEPLKSNAVSHRREPEVRGQSRGSSERMSHDSLRREMIHH